MGWDKIKAVIRYSWVLDNNGIKGPQIAVRVKLSNHLSIRKSQKENHNDSIWWNTRDHSTSTSGRKIVAHPSNIRICMEKKRLRLLCVIALMHVYVTQANFTTKPRFEIKNKRSFTEMNSQGSRVEKNTHAQKVQMQKILFTNEACW